MQVVELKPRYIELLDSVFPTLEQIQRVPRSGNAIYQLTIVVYGKQGCGKTTLIQTIVEYLAQKYGIDNVNAVWSKSNLDVLLRRGIQNKLVNVLCCEDITLRKFRTETLADFFNIRHIVAGRTHRRNGLVINIFTLHRYFGIKIELRTEHDLLLFKSAPTNPYDYSTIKRFLGPYYINELAKIQRERQTDISKMGLCAFYTGNQRGIVDFPRPDVNRITEIYLRKSSLGIVGKTIFASWLVFVGYLVFSLISRLT